MKVGTESIGLMVAENIFLMWDFAKPVFTNFNQSIAGCFFLLVIISTTSPFSSTWDRGTIFPPILAPSQWFPMSECTAYAKSTGVAPLGRDRISPFGVKAKISFSKKLIL